MSRPRKQTFVTRPLADLTHQLLQYAPQAKRAEQVRRAEALHDELDPDAAYPVAYLIYRVTRYRPEGHADELIPGEAAAADLRLLIDRLSHSAPQPLGPRDDPLASLDEVAARQGVSPRTLDRWRDRGLRWRWWRPEASRPASVGVPASAWERFAATHPGRVARAARFVRTPPDEAEAILRRAKQLAGEGATPHRASVRLAREFGRGRESIRQLLLKREADHPGDAWFPRRRGPLTPKQRRLIDRAHARGVPLKRLAERLHRSVPSIHHVVQQRRLARLKARRLRYVQPRDASEQGIDAVIARPLPAAATPLPRPRGDPPPRAADLPSAVAAVAGQTPPPIEAQRALAAKMHAMRCRVDRYRQSAEPAAPRARDLDAIEALADAADAIECRLVALGLESTLSVVRRHLQAAGEAGVGPLAERLAVGVAVLEEALLDFDPAASRTLESVVRNRLLRRFARDDRPAGRAHARPDPDVWTHNLLEVRGIACGWPRDTEPASRHDDGSSMR